MKTESSKNPNEQKGEIFEKVDNNCSRAWNILSYLIANYQKPLGLGHKVSESSLKMLSLDKDVKTWVSIRITSLGW